MHFDEFHAYDELLRVPCQINNNVATHFQRSMLDINYNIADCMQTLLHALAFCERNQPWFVASNSLECGHICAEIYLTLCLCVCVCV